MNPVRRAKDFAYSNFNENSRRTLGGMVAGLGALAAAKFIDPDSPVLEYAFLAAPSYFVLRGAVGNAIEYLGPGRIFRRETVTDATDVAGIYTAGVTMHLATDWFYALSGGLQPSPHDRLNAAYVISNIPTIYLMGKAYFARRRSE